jgi:hypothetical protein
MLQSVSAINDTLPSVLADLGKAAVAGKSDYSFVASSAMMDDVLPLINIVSKTMQAKDADFTNLVNLVLPMHPGGTEELGNCARACIFGVGRAARTPWRFVRRRSALQPP